MNSFKVENFIKIKKYNKREKITKGMKTINMTLKRMPSTKLNLSSDFTNVLNRRDSLKFLEVNLVRKPTKRERVHWFWNRKLK